MKKFTLLLILLFPLVFLTPGCKKEIIEPDPEPLKGEIHPTDTIVPVNNQIAVLVRTTAWYIVYTTRDEKDTIFSTPDVLGEWTHVFYFTVKDIGLNQALFYFYAKDGTVINRTLNATGTLPPDPVEMSLSAEPDTLPYGGGTTVLSWVSDADSVRLPDGTWVLANGSIEVFVDKDTTFGFLGVKKYTQRYVTISVIVLPMPTREDTLCKEPWRIRELRFQYFPGGPWSDPVIPDSCRLDDLKYFYLYPEKTSLYDMGEIPCFDGDSDATGYWYLESNGTVLVTYQRIGHNSYRDIKVLDEKILVLIDHYENGTSTETTYYHP